MSASDALLLLIAIAAPIACGVGYGLWCIRRLTPRGIHNG
jgi:hypothetical protein